jgi:chitin disaccharide deacetylase
MTEAAWLRIVPRIGPGITEVYCHPATSVRAAPRRREGSSPADELAALVSLNVRAALDRAGVRRMSFAAAASER